MPRNNYNNMLAHVGFGVMQAWQTKLWKGVVTSFHPKTHMSPV
jgi:hypothetical protein